MLPFDPPDWLSDIQDQALEVGYLTPREFAQLIDVAPQQVYKWIRNNVLETEHCRCGRRILNVNQSVKNLQEKTKVRSRSLESWNARASEYRRSSMVSSMQEVSEVLPNLRES